MLPALSGMLPDSCMALQRPAWGESTMVVDYRKTRWQHAGGGEQDARAPLWFNSERSFSYLISELSVLLKISSNALRITIAVLAVLTLLWWFGMSTPGN